MLKGGHNKCQASFDVVACVLAILKGGRCKKCPLFKRGGREKFDPVLKEGPKGFTLSWGGGYYKKIFPCCSSPPPRN